MKNRKGFVPIIIVGFIAVLAIAMTAIAFYYKSQKEKQPGATVVGSCSAACKVYGYPNGICEREGSSVESLQKQQLNSDKALSTIAGKAVTVNSCKFSAVGAGDTCYCLKSSTDKLAEVPVNTNSNSICQIDVPYENTAVSPISCSCPTGYSFSVISNGWGPCPTGMSDCPMTTQKCVPTTTSNINTNVSTAGWKTYTNNTFHYSLKYPTNYSVSGNDNRIMFSPTNSTGGNTLVIYRFTGSNDSSFNAEELSWYTNAKNNTFTGTLYSNKRATTIGGKSFTTFDFDVASTGSIQHYLVDAGGVWLIDDARSPKTVMTNDVILSTFTFTDQTAEWKTYTNDKYKYSFKYTAPYSIRTDVSTEEEVVLACGKSTECRDAVKIFSNFTSLDQWKKSLDQLVILSTENITVDNQIALRVNTGEFAMSKVGIYKGGLLYEISGNSFIDKGLLSTFTFTN